MTATYQLKSHELTDEFVKAVKETFYDKEITITVEETFDETAFLLQNKVNCDFILKSIEDYKQGKRVHTMTLEEAEALL